MKDCIINIFFDVWAGEAGGGAIGGGERGHEGQTLEMLVNFILKFGLTLIPADQVVLY